MQSDAGMANRRICIVEADYAARRDLEEQLGRFGFEVHGFRSLFEARGMVRADHPAALIVGLPVAEGDATMEAAALQLEQGGRERLPLLALAEDDSMESRLQAVRFGSVAFFRKPVDLDGLAGRLEEITADPEERRTRVLILEGDEARAVGFAGALEYAGMDVQIETRPELVMEGLLAHSADLLLMNARFPGALGMEVASVLRQQKAFRSVPIVMYADEPGLAHPGSVLRRGSDDVLAMPIRPEHLIASISARAERARIVRRMALTDSLTGVLNHTRLGEMLVRELARARRDGRSLVYAIVDIDRFKRINDGYGHAAGDRVIKALARLLKQRVSSEDRIGRDGGNRFGLILRSLDLETAARVFNEIRIDFSELRHRAEDGGAGTDFTARLSCGLAAFPAYSGQRELLRAADRALERVKERGGNRVGYSRPRRGEASAT